MTAITDVTSSDMSEEVATTEKLIVVTSDAHVGPSVEQFRQYCPQRYLSGFDEYYERNSRILDYLDRKPRDWTKDIQIEEKAGTRSVRLPAGRSRDELRQLPQRNALTAGGYDMSARIRDMDNDGVAAEVIYHGLVVGPTAIALPFSGAGSDPFLEPGFDRNRELSALGRHIYNQWLADFIRSSPEPERHVGLAQLPMWDIDAAVKELEWAAEAGLRGVNFPRSGSVGVLAYNDRAWEPFWSRCEELGMTLNTHAQGALSMTDGTHESANREGQTIIGILDLVSYVSRAALHYLVFGGVFERHPNLKLIFTEQPGVWWTETWSYMDSVFIGFHKYDGLEIGASHAMGKLSRLPSEYGSQVFIGSTCLAPFEARTAVSGGYDSQIMWGSDYPHVEGTYQYPRTDHEKDRMTRLAQRDAFAGLPSDVSARMLGSNAIHCYGLDRRVLQQVADRIEAPSAADLAKPIDFEPEPPVSRGAYFVFRRTGAYH